MAQKDSLGERMKDYENAYRFSLTKRMPVMIRIDGCHFHTYTKGMKRPFDEDLAIAFWETCKYLADNIMGCKLVYHQSDEITLLITNYEELNTESWFKNGLQKIGSVAASFATAKFNEVMRLTYPKKALASFDARVWTIPHDEVCNAFIWRQQDASKNSISMVAQANFSHSELQKLSGKQMQEKLFTEKGINWNDLPVWQKRGVCIRKETYFVKSALRKRWIVDHETPIFSKDRDYIEQYVFPVKIETDVKKDA
jgi:tRNA(His) guanylyltransferase